MKQSLRWESSEDICCWLAVLRMNVLRLLVQVEMDRMVRRQSSVGDQPLVLGEEYLQETMQKCWDDDRRENTNLSFGLDPPL